MEGSMNQTLESCRKNLERGRSVATGIGVFAFVCLEGREDEVLLRNRTEKGSLHGENLSGKWELPGGGVELIDYVNPIGPDGSLAYQWPFVNTLKRELMEEAGLVLVWNGGAITMLPASHKKDGIIDHAFTVDVPMSDRSDPLNKSTYIPLDVDATDRFEELLELEHLRFFLAEEIDGLDIISPRMRFMIESSFVARERFF